MDYEEEPDFSDDEDFVDEISDAELMSDLMSTKPKESDGVDSVIVVDGVPAVGADRLEKLKGVVRKIFTKVSKQLTERERERAQIYLTPFFIFSVRQGRERALPSGRRRQDQGLHLPGVHQPRQRRRGKFFLTNRFNFYMYFLTLLSWPFCLDRR